jgi:hypothetical protein
MIKKISLQQFAFAIFMSYLFSTPIFAKDNHLPKKLIAFTEKTLIKIAAHPTIVQAITDKNSQNASLKSIQEIDQVWLSTPGINPFMFDLLRNDCAFELLQLERQYPFVIESFATDNQGALVCMTRKTEDYWQGDETKFQLVYPKEGQAVYYSSTEHDEEDDELVVQISFPVKRHKIPIGTVIFTISLDRWERR